jgi:hypothetical protein
MTVQFNTGLWAESWRVTRLTAKYVLLYLVSMLAIAILPELLTEDGDFPASWVAQSFAAALLAVPAHLTVLRNRPEFDTAASNAMMGFVWRGLAIGAISFLPSLILVIVLLGPLGWEMIPSLIAMTALWLFVGSAAFAEWGTVLPAVITGHATNFVAVATRGSRTFGYAFPRLLVSFGLVTVVGISAGMAIAMLSTGDGRFFPVSGGVDVFMFTAIVVGTLIGALGIVMTAVVLSRAFLLAEGKAQLE